MVFWYVWQPELSKITNEAVQAAEPYFQVPDGPFCLDVLVPSQTQYVQASPGIFPPQPAFTPLLHICVIALAYNFVHL